MFDQQVLELSKIISELKDKLKCTICLDVIQETAEIKCGHKFCHDCYSKYKFNKAQPSCPLCKEVFDKRSGIYKEEFADKLGAYVSSLSDSFKKSYGHEVEVIAQSKHKIPGRIKAKKAATSKYARAKPSTSKNRPKAAISSSQDAFDMLLNNSQDHLIVNKKGTTKIYHNKKKKKEEQSDFAYKILDFGDDENKSAVLRWLNDTKNTFERLTQTQNIEVENNDDISNTDLVSVSQIRQNESDPQLRNTVRHRPRARSLDVELKKRIKERNRLLEGSNVDVKECYVIEDSDTEEEEIVKKAEENILLNIIEDKYLDKLENELQNNEIREPAHKDPPKEAQYSQPSTSGWGRIEKMSKTLRKKEKAPKKLNITVKSSQTSNFNAEKKENKDSSKRNSKNEAIAELPKSAEKQSPLKPANLENIQTPEKENVKIWTDIVSSSTPKVKAKNILVVGHTNENPKSYDLNAVETYISEHMEVIEKDDSSNTKDLSDPKNYEFEKDNYSNKENNENFVNNKQSNAKDLSDPTNYELEKDNYSNKENNENFVNIEPEKEKIIVLENVVLKNKGLDESSDKELEDPYLLPTQKLNISSFSKFNDYSKERLSDNNPFLILTQVITADKQTDAFLKPAPNNPSKEIDDYNMDCTVVHEHYESIEDLFSTLQKNLKYCQDSVNIEVIKDKLDIVNGCVTKLRELTIDKTITNIPVAVAKIPLKEFCDKVIQTSFDVQTKQVQTECCESVNREVQTEDRVDDKLDLDASRSSICVNDNIITQNTEKALHSILSESALNFEIASPVKQDKQTVASSATQNNCFSATLDNFCFDTQDITKESDKLGVSHKAQAAVSQKKTEKAIPNTSDSVNKEAAVKSQKSTKSVLMCSLGSEPSKKINRKLTYHDSLGTKRALSDSDDEIIMPKRICNRFIRDDLSIEFDINTETEITTQNKKNYSRVLLPDSDSVDYEDYLDKVMKKYDDNDCLISTPEKDKDGRKDVERDSSMQRDGAKLTDKTMECEEIIAQVNKNISKLSKNNDTKSSYKTATQSSEKSCRDDNLGLTEIIDMKEGEGLRGQTESSDIIGETESIEPLPKRPRKTNLDMGFDQGEFTADSPNQSIDLLGIARSNNEQAKVCQELDDSLDDAEFANIKISGEKELDAQQVDEPTEINEEKRGTSEVYEDLFSDDDIVETTPRKESSFAEKRSQRVNPCNLSFPLPPSVEVIENFNFDFTPLPPPPDFQDTPFEADKDDTYTSHHVTVIEFDQTLKDMAQSLTPDGLAQHERTETRVTSSVKSDLFRKDGFHSSTPRKLSQLDISKKRISSTQSSDSSCNLSPITGVKSVFEQAQASAHTPLSISRQSSRKQNILTSTPRQKSIWNYITSQSSDRGIVKSKPCIACTRLSKDKTQSISLLTNKKLATYSQVFDKSVTHMIVTVNEKNWIKDYTMKFVAAVAAGIWILNFEWVQECLSSNSIVPEEPYEVLDDTGLTGPKTARLTRKENPLMKGFKFYCANSLFSTTVEDVEQVIKMLGGTFVSTLDKLSVKDGKVGLIITEGRSTQDFEIYETWLELYKTATVDIEWLSKSVGRYKLLSIRPYIWCSDDNLDDLGYPPHLTEMVQSSSSEQY